MKFDPKETLSVRIRPELIRRLDELCERAGTGRAEMVERCLAVGLDEQQEFVGALQRPLVGELAHALTHPKVLTVLAKLIGSDMQVDDGQMKIRETMKQKRRGGAKAKPAAR